MVNYMYRKTKQKTQDFNELGGAVSFDTDIRTIFIEGDIDTSDVSSFYQAIIKMRDRKTPITILINSGGGGLVEAMAIIDMIKVCDVQFNAIVAGMCCSAATLIACSCKHRSATKHSTFMIHEMSNHIESRYTELREEVRMNDQWMNNIISIYQEATGHDREFLRDILLRTKWMSSIEAIDFGLIDQILEKLPTQRRRDK